jgi:hypothetical protein
MNFLHFLKLPALSLVAGASLPLSLPGNANAIMTALAVSLNIPLPKKMVYSAGSMTPKTNSSTRLFTFLILDF